MWINRLRSYIVSSISLRGEEEENIMNSWKKWIKCAGVRAIKTVAQTAVATVGTAAVMGEVNWVMVGSAALLAGILSLLTSVAGLPECSTDDGENAR